MVVCASMPCSHYYESLSFNKINFITLVFLLFNVIDFNYNITYRNMNWIYDRKEGECDEKEKQKLIGLPDELKMEIYTKKLKAFSSTKENP